MLAKSAVQTIFSSSIIGLALLSGGIATADTIRTPISEEAAKLLASDGQHDDFFGRSVSVDGDTAVVGAAESSLSDDQEYGAAYVFKRVGGVWIEQQKLLASDGQHDDFFGRSVPIDGDTVVVGAPGADDNGRNSGAAYVFKRVGGVWTEQQKLLASDGQEFHSFGRSISIDEDTVVVGSDGAGAAYVFKRVGGVWTEQQKLLASDGQEFHSFGRSVSVDGDIAVIGSFESDAAYIFKRVGEVWTEQQKLLASDPQEFHHFGGSVSIDEDTVVIGANSDNDNGEDSGSAYVFERVGEVWTEQQKLLASDGQGYERLGWSVSVDGDTAVIGAPFDDAGSGSAYVFERVGGLWTEQQKLLVNDGQQNNTLGYSVSVDDDTAVVGALNGSRSGSAHVFSTLSDVNVDTPLTISPPTGRYYSTQNVDLMLHVNHDMNLYTTGTVSYRGIDVSSALSHCWIAGTADSGSSTYRCPLTGENLGEGDNRLEVEIQFSDDAILRQSVVWSIEQVNEGFGIGHSVPEAVAPSLTISPPTGTYHSTQNFDLLLHITHDMHLLTSGTVSHRGSDVTGSVQSCWIVGTAASGGSTYRCPVEGENLGEGDNVLEVQLSFSDGVMLTESVTWTIEYVYE